MLAMQPYIRDLTIALHAQAHNCRRFLSLLIVGHHTADVCLLHVKYDFVPGMSLRLRRSGGSQLLAYALRMAFYSRSLLLKSFTIARAMVLRSVRGSAGSCSINVAADFADPFSKYAAVYPVVSIFS